MFDSVTPLHRRSSSFCRDDDERGPAVDWVVVPPVLGGVQVTAAFPECSPSHRANSAAAASVVSRSERAGPGRAGSGRAPRPAVCASFRAG